ncbi:hypothetical protein F2Q69_00019626 [Brassica cretica]|uniref:Uncharacterized protein n=1 Tax=Brassica cretica TaxID=69181 RepID=A0A8S9Q1Z4_BRACR|nr:hypothetical protein F2Q69_00019626 [Brassica cretica]
MKMQDVCPEVVVDVVANADDMLSGEDHVESRCQARVVETWRAREYLGEKTI